MEAIRVSGRTRSIWLTQLSLAGAVIVIALMAMVLAPVFFGRLHFVIGTAVIVGLAALTIGLPWDRLPKQTVLAVPFLDAVAIGVLAFGTDLRLSFLWAFPVMWAGMHFRLPILAVMLALIGGLISLEILNNTPGATALRVFIVLSTLAFIGITAHLAMRQVRASRRLMARQASRLHATVERRSEQERRTNEILNAVDIGVARVATSGPTLSINSTYGRLYGIDPRDPEQPARSVEYSSHRGMPVPPSDRTLARAARGDTFHDRRVWIFTTDGQWRTLSVTAKRLRSSLHEEETILLLVHDVTAVTHAQRERERLAAIASHELRHPLTVMIGTAELALEDETMSPKAVERFQKLLDASERMLEMTEQMLGPRSAVRSEAPPVDPSPREKTDLQPILIDSVASYEQVGRAKDVRVSLSTTGRLRAVVDGFRMRQVFDNLVSNAVKYTVTGGEVDITAGIEGDDVVVSIADTGIGIAPEDIPRVLTPYFRTAEAKKTATGTGLGLGITREIVEAHGGSLTIDSALGEGTVITVRLPRGVAEAKGD
ncbi:ATP-binding protein [Microbacterium aurantiacum]|uniref:Sensor-like histidine kinase SenX3 n=1 Tax=Microbacterium aurantiacum TaxID=162393 RepID=A0ABT8FPB3_9MICO|nr:ATP-binding protein [Microbacterium aurantiacum]MDN4463099.1 PAS domain-containing sensor histidine kinase [Microbacterium aurantiacum]